MLRFRLGSIPVEVQLSHLAFSALLGYGQVRGRGDVVGQVLAWMVIIFVSVLVHELGHALAAKSFGYRPSIQLAALGGNTTANAPGPIPWGKDLVFTLAGPAFGLGLGVIALVLKLLLGGMSRSSDWFLTTLAVANGFWAIFNLLPVIPLDGGRIARLVLGRIFGRPGVLVAHVLGLAICGVAILFSVRYGWIITALFFGLFAMRIVAEVAAHLRGEDEAPAATDHPSEALLQQAHEAYRTGQLDSARRVALELLEAESPQPVVARAHHLLGWISLKEGLGRAALDHFSQVQRFPVENHALAAAFSLLGDDARALALWELAFRETGDRTVLHEWAGALVRLGRTDEARRLPSIDMAPAFACAQRVLLIRQEFDAAAQVGHAALREGPSPQVAYDTACALARAGRVDESLSMLEQAAVLGFSDAVYASSDPDLAHVQGNPRFSAWLTGLRKSASP
jgi:Zn-dependent protease